MLSTLSGPTASRKARAGLDILFGVRRGGMYILEGMFVDMGEIPVNPHLLVSKSLRLIGLSNHPFTGYGPSMDLMLRY